MRKLLVLFIFLFVFVKPVSAQVVINEFHPYDSNDWIELYSDEDVDISGWKIFDSKSQVGDNIPEETFIGPSYDLFYVFDAEDRLNVDEDVIYLKNADENEIDSVSYGNGGLVCKTENNEQSIGRASDGDTNYVRFANYSKGKTNNEADENSCPTSTPTSTPDPTDTPEPDPTETPTPKPTKTSTPTPKPSLMPSPNALGASDESSLGAQQSDGILALRDQLNSPTPDPSESEPNARPLNVPILAAVFIFSGVGLISAAGYPFLKELKKRYTEKRAKSKIQN